MLLASRPDTSPDEGLRSANPCNYAQPSFFDEHIRVSDCGVIRQGKLLSPLRLDPFSSAG